MRRLIKAIRIANPGNLSTREHCIGDTINGEIIKYIYAENRDGRIYFLILADKPANFIVDELLKHAILQIIPSVDERIIIEFYKPEKSETNE